MTDHPEVIEVLLDAGADRTADQGANMTALHLAAMVGWVEIIRSLAAHGADLDRRDDEHQATPLMWARYNRHPEAAKLLESLAGNSG